MLPCGSGGNGRPADPVPIATAVARMREREIALLRLNNQGLATSPFESAGEAVRWLGAVQSQEPILARWSVAQRCARAAPELVNRALADGTILRTHVLRPTWHFVHRDDIRWLLDLTAPRILGMAAHRLRELELDAHTLSRGVDAIVAALAGGGELTRRQLAAVLEQAGIATTGQRLVHILMHAELSGVICGGAPQGRHHTYAMLDFRAPDSTWLPHDEALAELTVRYFVSRGPATATDFRWWSSLPMSDVKRGIAMAGTELERLELDGRVHYHRPAETHVPDSSPALLIQEFDEYLVGYTESRGVCDVARVLGPATTLTRAMLVNGQVAGRWRRGRDGRIEIERLRALDEPAERAVLEAAERCGEFLGALQALPVPADSGATA